jgi:hypothetical protein
MKSITKGWAKVIGGLCLLMTTAVYAESADQYVEEARRMVQNNDFGPAAVLYQKALKLDQSHAVAKKEFREVMFASREEDPSAEHSEAEWALLQEAAAPAE